MARGHKLVTKEIERKLEKAPIYSQGSEAGKDINDAPVLVKFFNPYDNLTYYAVEAERREDGDLEFFGLVVNDGYGEQELTYWTLSQLEGQTRMNGRLPLVERDCYFGEHTLGEFLK